MTFLPISTKSRLQYIFCICALVHHVAAFIVIPTSTSTSTTTTFSRSSSSFRLLSSSPPPPSSNESLSASQLKQDLLDALTELKQLQDRDGDFSDVNWGSSGGELTETGRVPRRVDYSVISKDVGAAAQKVLNISQQLAQVSPTAIPTQYLGDHDKGEEAPLNGSWKLLFSNAADAVFSKDSKRGAAKTQNVVNAKRGRITNIIDFATGKNGKQPTLKQLQVIIKATAVDAQRVQLDFRYAKVKLTKLFGLPLFGKTLTLYIPIPAAFVTACIEFVKRIGRFLGLHKKTTNGDKDEDNNKRSTQGYFDVLYLDHQLRVHETGQGNLFVQAKEEQWPEARPLIR